MKKKQIAEICLMIAGCILFSACSGELPLNRRMIVQNAGVDEAGGTFTLSVNAYLADRSAAGEKENASDVFFSGSGDSVTDAMDEIGLVTGRKPYFPHNQAVVIGQTTAEHGIGAALSFFTEFYECRGSVALYLTQGTAEALLSSVGQDGSIPARELAALAEAGKQAGCAVYAEVFTAAQCLTDGERDFCAPILGLEQAGDDKSRIAVSGTALFSGEKMVDVLNERQTQGVLIASGDAESMSLKTEIPAKNAAGQMGVQVAVENLRTAVRCSAENGAAKVALTVRCDAAPAEWDFAAQTGLDEEMAGRLKNECEREISKRVREAIDVCAQRHGADPFGFGRNFAQQAPEWWRANREKWKAVIRDCEFSVDVFCRVKAGAMQPAGQKGKS